MLGNITHQFRVEVRFGTDDANEAPASKTTAGVYRFQTRYCVFLNPCQAIA